MATFDVLSGTYKPSSKDKRSIVYYNLTIGALAGVVAVILTYPTDLLRKLM